jgi:hypothetical protein
MADPSQMLDWFKTSSVKRDKALASAIDHVDLNLAGQITVGEFVDRNRECYEELIGVAKHV